MNTSSIPQLFEAVHLAVVNLSENEELQKTMNGYGFNAKRVQEGNTLLVNARQMHGTQEQHYDGARELSVQIAQDKAAALEVFREHVTLAKTAFRKEPHILEELKIRKSADGGWAWTQQATDFYGKAPKYMERLQQYGVTEASFQQNKAAVEALVALKVQRLKKKGYAEHSTQLRNETIRELRAWYGEFRKLARMAFKETPQVLEIFGIVVPSSRKKRKETVKE